MTTQQEQKNIFWPTFVFALPATSVVAGLTMLYIAINTHDSKVIDDYYKEGLAINQKLSALQKAEELGIQSEMTFNRHNNLFTVFLNAENLEMPKTLNISLEHPLNKSKDMHLIAKKTQTSGEYITAAPISFGSWYLQISDGEPKTWTIKSKISYQPNQLSLAESNPNLSHKIELVE